MWGGNLSISRKLFYEVKGSHPDYLQAPFGDYQGDGECGLTKKIGALGLSGWYSPRCEVAHRVPASRMTVEYLERRAFFQGLVESFADYRREHGLEPAAGVERPGLSSRVSLGSYIRSVARRVGLGGVRRGLVGAMASRDADRGSDRPCCTGPTGCSREEDQGGSLPARGGRRPRSRPRLWHQR